MQCVASVMHDPSRSSPIRTLTAMRWAAVWRCVTSCLPSARQKLQTSCQRRSPISSHGCRVWIRLFSTSRLPMPPSRRSAMPIWLSAPIWPNRDEWLRSAMFLPSVSMPTRLPGMPAYPALPVRALTLCWSSIITSRQSAPSSLNR